MCSCFEVEKNLLCGGQLVLPELLGKSTYWLGPLYPGNRDLYVVRIGAGPWHFSSSYGIGLSILSPSRFVKC